MQHLSKTQTYCYTSVLLLKREAANLSFSLFSSAQRICPIVSSRMAGTEDEKTPRDPTTPFASSTTRSSLAWPLDGAPVNFTRQTAEATDSQPPGSEESAYYSDIHSPHQSHLTLTSTNESMDEANAATLSHNVTAVPSGLSTPNGGLTRSPSLVEHDVPAKHADSALEACPVLSNEILMKANPRGPRQQKWAGRLKRQLWW